MASIIFVVADILAKLAASRRRPEPVNLSKVAVQTGLNAVSEIIKSDCGRPNCISCCFDLPTDGFTSGKANEEKNSGAADAPVMTSAPLAQLCVKEKKAPGDVIGLNKVAVQAGLFSQYRATHDTRRKDSGNKKTSLKLVKGIPVMTVFEIPTKPCTPDYSLVGHKYQGLLLKEATRARHVPKNIIVELKVTIETLKMELFERQELLIKALNVMEALAQYSGTQIKQSELGRLLSRCFTLPPDGFTYGEANEEKNSGAADALEMMSAPLAQLCVKEKKATREVIGLIKAAVQAGLYSQYRATHDMRRKDSDNEKTSLKLVKGIPVMTVFEFRTKPCTPVYSPLGHKYHDLLLKEATRARHVPQNIIVELKVTVETLKMELVKRQELLIKAPNVMEALAQYNDTQIQQSELGRPLIRCFTLPPDGFTYGKANEEKDSGAADALVMTSAPLAQLCVKEKKAPRNVIGLNKAAVEAGLFSQYRATHDMRRKDSGNEKTSLKLVKGIPVMTVFEIPTKPCTPVYSPLGHKHQDLLLKEATRGRQVPKNIQVELKVTVETLKTELVERQELLIKAPNLMEALAKYSGTRIRQLKEELNEELREIREGHETKLNGMKKTAAKHVMEDMVEKLVAMKAKLDEKDRMIDELKGSVVSVQRDNKELRKQLYDKEQEQLVDNSLSQNCTCEDDSTGRDSELQKLQSKVEDLNESLIATRDAAHTTERKWCQAFGEQAEALKELEAKINALQNSLSAKDVELAKGRQQSKEPSAAKQLSASDCQKAKEVQKKNRQPPGVSDETKNIKKPPKTALRK